MSRPMSSSAGLAEEVGPHPRLAHPSLAGVELVVSTGPPDPTGEGARWAWRWVSGLAGGLGVPFDAFHGLGFFARHRVVHDGEFGGLEALDLVAQAGGLFEVEVGGGVAHLLFQRVEMGLQVAADEVAAIGEALAR